MLPFPEGGFKLKNKLLIVFCTMLLLFSISWATDIKDDMKFIGPVTIDGVIQEQTDQTDGTSICFEGTTADAYETCFLIVDPTADRVITFGDSSFTAGSTNAHTSDVTITGTTPMLTIGDGGDEDINVRFDGNTTQGNFQACVDATDDDWHFGAATLTTACGTSTAFQITDSATPALTVTAPTTFNGNVTVGNAVTDAVTFTGAIQGTNAFILDGSTDDTNELTVAVTDPVADKTLTLPSTTTAAVMITELTTNDVDVVNSVWGGSNQIEFEGATANDFETFLVPTDVGADATITLPSTTGTLMNVAGVGSYRSVEDITADDVQTTADCGKTITLSHATVAIAITLPAPTSGCYFKIIHILATNQDHTVATNADANLIIGGINELEVDTNDDGPYATAGDLITFVNSLESIGDYIELISDGTKWYLNGQTNLDGGITIGST